MAITVEAVHRKVQYTSTGGLGPYSFSFKVLAATDIKVSVGTTEKTVTTHYTTTYNANGTGSVTFTSGNAPASGALVTIESDQAIARTTDYATGGDFTADSINDALDRLTINDQQIETELSRNIQLAGTTKRTTSSTGTSGPITWPYDDTPSNNASKVVAYDSAGTALELGPSTTDITSASTNATAAATSATAAASSASAASTSATASASSATTAAATAATLTGASSTTSLAIGTGSKAFTVAAGLGFIAGDIVLVTSNANPTVNYMHGPIASYSSTTLTVTVDNVGGSGTLSDWTIRRSGTRGATGATGSTGPTGATGSASSDAELSAIAGLTSAAGKMIEFTGSGTAQVIDVTTAGKALMDDANASAQRTTMGVAIGSDVAAYNADTLFADVADNLTAGFSTTVHDAGTKSSGTYTPDQDDGNIQKAVNGGAHTLAPTSDDCAVIIQYTNNASAGTITTSGFTLVDGDDISTTNGDDFFFYLTKANGFSLLTVKALQ